MHPHKKYIILIVDDSEFITTRVIELLAVVDNVDSIYAAANFAEGAAKFSDLQPSLVLLDINLPDKSGIELLRHIKSASPSTEVIMLTNQSDSYYRNLCGKLGAREFIDKTRDFENLPAVVAGLVV